MDVYLPDIVRFASESHLYLSLQPRFLAYCGKHCLFGAWFYSKWGAFGLFFVTSIKLFQVSFAG